MSTIVEIPEQCITKEDHLLQDDDRPSNDVETGLVVKANTVSTTKNNHMDSFHQDSLDGGRTVQASSSSLDSDQGDDQDEERDNDLPTLNEQQEQQKQQEQHDQELENDSIEQGATEIGQETTTNLDPEQQDIMVFPKSFYCGWSNQLMVHPVVHPNGESYEHSVAIERDSTITYYPNRALQAIIEYELQQRTLPGTFRTTIRSNMQQLLEKKSTQSSWDGSSSTSTSTSPTTTTTTTTIPSSSSIPSQSHRSTLPEEYFCPITQELLYDPVIDPDGNTFERKALIEWYQLHHSSPMTRNPYPFTKKNQWKQRNMLPSIFYPNKALSKLMEHKVGEVEAPNVPKILPRKPRTRATTTTTPTTTSTTRSNNEPNPYQKALVTLVSMLFIWVLLYKLPSSL